MLSRRGARVLHGPTMTTELLGDLDATDRGHRALLAEPVDLVVLTTGIGVRSWFGAAESVGLEDALRARVRRRRGRGPWPQGAVGSSPGRPRGDVDGADRDERRDPRPPRRRRHRRPARRRAARRRRAAVRRPLLADLRPATIVDVPVYRWHMPEDVAPAARLLDAVADRQVDAVTFTSSYAVHNAFEIASRPGTPGRRVRPRRPRRRRRPGDRRQRCASSVSTRVVEPERARLGSMIRALSGCLEERARTLDPRGHVAALAGHGPHRRGRPGDRAHAW